MSVEERILIIAEGPNWYDSPELRAIALEVRKMEDRIKQLEEMYEGILKRKMIVTQKRIRELETEKDAMRADLLLWNEQEVKP